MFIAAPVMRQVARIELPSTRALTMRVRYSMLSLFTIIVYVTAQASSSVNRVKLRTAFDSVV